MFNQNEPPILFHQYFKSWVSMYKEGAVRTVTLNKYHMTHKWLERLAPNLILSDVDRKAYQQVLNEYRVTASDFQTNLKAVLLDAVDEGLLDCDPTRKAIIKGKSPNTKKNRFLNQFELSLLLKNLNLPSYINNDWLLLLIAKTGMTN